MFDCAATSVLTSAVPANPRRRTNCAPNSHPTWPLADATTVSRCLKNERPPSLSANFREILKKSYPSSPPPLSSSYFPANSQIIRARQGRRGEENWEGERKERHSNFPPVCLKKSDPIKDRPVPVSFQRFRDERRGLMFSVFLETAVARERRRRREGQD